MNQTTLKNVILPDGFKLSYSTDAFASEDIDVGVLAGGANIVFNWTNVLLNAGNMKQVVVGRKDITVELTPTAIWHWDAAVLAALSQATWKSTAATTPGIGFDLEGGHSELKEASGTLALKLEHTNAAGNIDFEFIIHNATLNPGGSFNFKGAEDDGVSEITLGFTGNVLTTGTAGEQLFKFFLLT